MHDRFYIELLSYSTCACYADAGTTGAGPDNWKGDALTLL